MAGKHYVLFAFALVLYGSFPVATFADYNIDLTTATGERCWPSVDNSDYRCGQEFLTTAAGSVSSVTIKAAKHNSPTQLLTATIQTINASVPSGTVLGTSATFDSSTLGATACSSGGNSVTFTFATPVELDAATNYAVVITGNANNNTNYPALCGKNPGDTAGMDIFYGTSAAWTASSPSQLYLYMTVTEAPPQPEIPWATSTPDQAMNFETFSTVFYALSISMAAYFALFVFRFFTG